VPSLQVGYVWHAGVHAAEVAEGLVRIGFEIVSQIIWDKGLFAMGRSWYHWGHEPAWAVRRPGVPNLFVGTDHTQSTIWRAPSPKMLMGGSKEDKYDHPAQKPAILYEIPIANHIGDVYDPFLGSGTTIIAAERLGRRCFAMEIDPATSQSPSSDGKTSPASRRYRSMARATRPTEGAGAVSLQLVDGDDVGLAEQSSRQATQLDLVAQVAELMPSSAQPR